MKKILASITLTAVLLPALALAGEGWETDFEKAKAKAKQEGKFLLLDFSGSDWCHWCVKLDQEVFSQPAFKEYAAKQLVPVLLDFPMRKELPAALKAQNTALQKKYQIRGYPTVVLLDPDGKKVAQTGYKRGGAAKYVEHLEELLKPHRSDTDGEPVAAAE